jgi:hypothetical protein
MITLSSKNSALTVGWNLLLLGSMLIVDAYMQFVKNNAGHLSAPPIAVDDPKTVRSSQVKHEETPSQPTSSSGCGTCGGGKVR